MRLSRFFDTEIDKKLITVSNPTDECLKRLTYTLSQADKIRDKFGVIIITSGYRPAKGKYSQHQDGYAIDFIVRVANAKDVFKWIITNLPFDQCIYETDENGNVWIHYSVKEYGINRSEALVANQINGKWNYNRYSKQF